MTKQDGVVIASAVRTPLGRFQGELAGLPAHALGAHVIRAAIARAGLAPEKVDEVAMGCVRERRAFPMRSVQRPSTRSAARV
jgi:acetyl-CoA C-acetyltransferase